MKNKTFLVTYEALIGRVKEDGADHQPVELTFYVAVRAKDVQHANDMVVQYSDRGFVAKVTGIAELGDQVSADDLYALLEHSKVLRVQQ
jgi:hypothetical protein